MHSTGLVKAGYNNPTEIQREGVALALRGCDVLGAAKTGSGKTLAFLIPVSHSSNILFVIFFISEFYICLLQLTLLSGEANVFHANHWKQIKNVHVNCPPSTVS